MTVQTTQSFAASQASSRVLGATSGRPCLAVQRVSAEACGKAILIGEHAVVYGYPAIAAALPGLTLQISVSPGAPRLPGPRSWDEAWQILSTDAGSPMTAESRAMLTTCFAAALRECSGGLLELGAFAPQPVVLDMRFPTSAGLGGSAALCVAALRLASRLAALHGAGPSCADAAAEVPSRMGLERAARLDEIFHGKASGIDTATSYCGGLVLAQGPSSSRRFAPIVNGRPFYLVLVDSGTRSSTAGMVAGVAELKRVKPRFVASTLERLGDLAAGVASDLAAGQLDDLGARLNEAHDHLSGLGLSTPSLDRSVDDLRKQGALGAKLTGSGGGGFALGVFRDYPSWVEASLPTKGAAYVSEVPAVRAAECERRAAFFSTPSRAVESHSR